MYDQALPAFLARKRGMEIVCSMVYERAQHDLCNAFVQCHFKLFFRDMHTPEHLRCNSCCCRRAGTSHGEQWHLPQRGLHLPSSRSTVKQQHIRMLSLTLIASHCTHGAGTPRGERRQRGQRGVAYTYILKSTNIVPYSHHVYCIPVSVLLPPCRCATRRAKAMWTTLPTPTFQTPRCR